MFAPAPTPAQAPALVPGPASRALRRLAAACWLAGAGCCVAGQATAQPLPTLTVNPAAPQAGGAGLAQAVGAALTLAVQHVRTPPGARLEVEPGQLDPRLKLAPCTQVEPYLPAHSRLWGRTRIGLRCLNGPVRWNVYLPVTVKLWAQAVVTTQPLAAGSVLKATDLTLAEVDLAAGTSPARTRPAELVGRSLAQSLSPGSTIREDSLRQRVWFSAGDVVTVVARGPGYAVSGSATALSHGIEGQSVRLRTESGRIISATPTGHRQVEITL